MTKVADTIDARAGMDMGDPWWPAETRGGDRMQPTTVSHNILSGEGVGYACFCVWWGAESKLGEDTG